MLFSKIMVAYDGSEMPNRALQMSVELAKADESIQIIVLHSVESVAALTEFTNYSIVSRIEEAKKHGELIKEKAEKMLVSISNHWSIYIVEDRPEKAILNQSKVLHADLIVMGSRGLSGLKEFFLGSVSHYVTQHSSIPVLIVK